MDRARALARSVAALALAAVAVVSVAPLPAHAVEPSASSGPTAETPAASGPDGASLEETGGVVAVVRRPDGSLAVERFVTAAGVTAGGATAAGAALGGATAAGAASDAAALAAVRARPDVVAADVDVPTRALGADPLRAQQWPLDTLRAERVWTQATGAGVTVAVLDSGVDATHPDLRRAVVPGSDLTGEGGDGRRDDRGHGTHVAGIIAATRGNSAGTAGLAPDVTILPVRVLDSSGSGRLSWAAEGIIWAVDRGADVITMSLGASRGTAVLDAAVAYAHAKDVVLVAASGNDGATAAQWPAAHRDVIAVGASTPTDAAAEFSNRDAGLDLVAPGTAVLSTCLGARWCLMSGTSMATPHVAAAAAMLRGLRPELTAAEARTLLQRTAVDRGARGHDPVHGWGRLDVDAAIRALPPRGDPFLSRTTGLTRVGGVAEAAAVAAATSAVAFPDGAELAVVARDDVFADSLTGAALAGRRGPVLFTAGGPGAGLDARVATELRRLLDPGATVYVLGGTAAVSDRAATAIAGLGFTVRRVSGQTRVETAAKVADVVAGGHASGGHASAPADGTVLLARSDQWADAVTGGSYAAATSTPILLTASDALDAVTRTWLLDNQVDQVVVLGGEAAISPTVVSQLTRLGVTVRRVGGRDRAATATAVARDLWQRRAGAPGDTFVVVEGYGPRAWAPAVAAAVLGATAGAPQLLVASGSLPAGTAEYLSTLRYGPAGRAAVVAVGADVGSAVGYALMPLIGH